MYVLCGRAGLHHPHRTTAPPSPPPPPTTITKPAGHHAQPDGGLCGAGGAGEGVVCAGVPRDAQGGWADVRAEARAHLAHEPQGADGHAVGGALPGVHQAPRPHPLLRQLLRRAHVGAVHRDGVRRRRRPGGAAGAVRGGAHAPGRGRRVVPLPAAHGGPGVPAPQARRAPRRQVRQLLPHRRRPPQAGRP